ncbi:MAG TPA: amidohydrolase family protein [Allosphingosinicella sp.]|nr:amidohydrolase family protein [Allosphingosinicella sp.]
MPGSIRIRSSLFLALLALVLFTGFAATSRAQTPATHGVEYRGGRWFDGTRFVPRTVYVVDGLFRSRAPARVDRVVDLAGGFVVPPFADAHQHLYAPIEPTIRAYLRDGIFYVKDQANAPLGRQAIHAALNRPTSFDYLSANQGWTSPGGHPVEVILRAAPAGTPMGDMIRQRMDPDFAMLVDTPADVARHWPLFMAGTPRPDFVKVFLFYSEDHARRRADARFEGNRGMDPALVPVIVRLAHRAGLQVSAHVYTAADFRAAVEGGVDQIAHLPGGHLSPDATFLLTDADARRAARRGVTVITTITQHGDAALTDRLVRNQFAHNIRLLRRAGVPLLLGSDRFGDTAVTEAAALARSGLFTNLELLRLWSVTTPRAIFPSRRIGRLADGYEASFLVLGGDPLADFANTRRIVRRVRQGVELPPAR